MASPNSKQTPKPKGSKTIKQGAKKTQAPPKPKRYMGFPNSRALTQVNDPHVLAANLSLAGLKGSRRYLDYARQMILPGHTSVAQVLPARAPAQMCSRIIRKNYVLGASNITADGRAAIVMTPDLYGPAYILHPGAILLPTAPGPFSINGRFTTDKSYVLGAMKGAGNFVSGNGLQKALAFPQRVDIGGDVRAAWDISCVSACTVVVRMRKANPFLQTCRVRFYTSSGGAWAATFNGIQLASSALIETQYTVAMAANTRYFGFYFEDSDGLPSSNSDFVVDFNISYGENSQTPQASIGSTTETLFQEIPDYILDSRIESGRVNSFAVLASNVTAELDKQGEVYACRAPRDILLDWEDPASAVAALPDNRKYIGNASTGAYAWWMADTIEASNPTTIGQYSSNIRGQDILVIFFKGLKATSAINVTFVWNVEFHTQNQLFEKIPTPPVTPEWEQMLHALALVQAASCNPEHEGLFSQIVSKGSKYAKAAYSHYKEHEQTYNMLMTLLSALASSA